MVIAWLSGKMLDNEALDNYKLTVAFSWKDFN
jgi:hypothetical protein